MAFLPNNFEDIDVMVLSSKAKLLLLSAVLILGSNLVIAQEIKSATFASPQAAMGSAVDMTIVFQSTPGVQPWCGLLIEWGDGGKANIRIGDDNFKTSPFTLSHKYIGTGTFNAVVKGDLMFRGLKTAKACDGVLKSATINVVDTAAIQQAETKRVAVEKEKAAAERVKKAAAQDSERAKKDIELKELEMKLRELEMREEMRKREEEIRKREEELRKKSQEQRPIVPVPAPAPAGGNPPVKPASGF